MGVSRKLEPRTNLAVIRVRRGMSIAHLSEESGVSAGQISRIERGLHSPSLTIAKRLARALSSSLDDLFPEPAEESA